MIYQERLNFCKFSLSCLDNNGKPKVIAENLTTIHFTNSLLYELLQNFLI